MPLQCQKFNWILDKRIIRLIKYFLDLLPMERMDKWDLLHIGTTYVEVHTFKWKDYITVRDFNTTTNALSKEILDLGKENKKLKEELSKYKKQYEHSMWEDSELIYEEWLYD